MGKRVIRSDRGWYFTPKTYDGLNQVVKIVLPALGAFYAAMALIWKWGYSTEVVGSLAAITVFGGILLNVSKSFWLQDDANVDGAMQVNTTNPMKDSLVLDLKTMDPEEIKKQDTLLLRVEDVSDSSR